MIIYIAGAMTGLPNFNREAFNAAAEKLREEGHTVLNPAFLPDGLTEKDYMAICLPMVMASETVFMLSGWEGSKGAKTEHSLAVKCGIPIEYQKVEHRPSLTELKQELEKHWRKPLVFISTPCSRVSYIHPYPESEEAPYVGFQHGATLPTSMMETFHIQTGAGKTPKDTSEKVEAIEKQKITCPFGAVRGDHPWVELYFPSKTDGGKSNIELASKLVNEFFTNEYIKPNGEPLYYLLYKSMAGKFPGLKNVYETLDREIIIEMEDRESFMVDAEIILKSPWGKSNTSGFMNELKEFKAYVRKRKIESINTVENLITWMDAKGFTIHTVTTHSAGYSAKVVDMYGRVYMFTWGG